MADFRFAYRWGSRRSACALLQIVLAGVSVGPALLGLKEVVGSARQAGRGRASAPAEYIGSKACAQCHRGIYNSYSQTSMGRSMSEVNASFLAKIPASASIFDARLNRHFEMYLERGNLYQSEFEAAANGKEVFRDTHKVEWIIGAGANGLGAIVRRGNYLFEAPLSFYSNANRWALSPGYEFGDYGFSRPILPGCIGCHSGRPQPVADGNGRFKEPPFAELAIGCENCHGPGRAHVREEQNGVSEQTRASSIVNPAKLAPWLADNICMLCHQTGQARVVQPGKQSSDFRPGAALDQTLSIFRVPFGPESVPQDDLLEHYFSMRLSKCYRSSGERLACITCHDPHVEPAEPQVSGYFRPKCLACHTEQSCSAAPEVRQRTRPTDDCVGCHMPKRNLRVISHSVLTNHRLIARPDEPFPEVAFKMTTPELPDLVHINAVPGKPASFSPLTLLEAYRQVMLSYPSYRQRYWALAKQLESTEPENISVLEAMADLALQEKSLEGVRRAIGYLDRARRRGTAKPADFEQLARLLVAVGRQPEAITVLQQGIDFIPYDSELYRLLGRTYLSVHNEPAACQALGKANRIFPQDRDIRDLLERCHPVRPTVRDPDRCPATGSQIVK